MLRIRGMARRACNGGYRFIVSYKFSSIEIVSARRSSSIIITFGSMIRWTDDGGCRSWRSSSIIITFGSMIRWSDDGDCRSWRSSSIIITSGSTIRWTDDGDCRSWKSSSILGSSWRSSLSVIVKTADN